MKTDEGKKLELIPQIHEDLRVFHKRHSPKYKELVQGIKGAFIHIVEGISDCFKEHILLGFCVIFLYFGFALSFFLIMILNLIVFCALMLLASLEVVIKTIIRYTKQKVVLTATKRVAYTLLRYNLWRMLQTYQEDLKIRLPEYEYSMTPSNPYVLRGNVWMCCYILRKRQPMPFESEHLEFIQDAIDEEINAMIRNMAFEGVVYPCSYRFVADEVIDSKNTVRVYVLLIEDERDIAYLRNKYTIIHDTVDALEVMEDSDFGKS